VIPEAHSFAAADMASLKTSHDPAPAFTGAPVGAPADRAPAPDRPEQRPGLARRAGAYLVESVRELWVRPPHQMPALDGLRALAILLVMCAHFFGFFWTSHVREPLPSMSNLAPFRWGWTGVDLFFVLSGYLIGKQLWRERFTTGSVMFWRFILRRGLRIWPLFFAMLLYYSFVPSGVHTSVWDFTFLTNFHRGLGFDDAWSLSTEEQFYIIVPLLLILTARIRRVRIYYMGCAAVVAGEWLARLHVMRSLSAQGLSGHVLLDAMHYPIYLHCDALIAGLVIALFSERHPARFRAPMTTGVSWPGLAIALGSAALAVGIRTANKTLFAFAALGLLYGGLTLFMLWDRSFLSDVARWRVWYPISRLSYGMYLNNYSILPGITYVAFIWTRRVTHSTVVGSLVGLVVATLVSMGVATVSFVLVERPFLILRDRKLHRRVHMHAAATPDGPYPGTAAPGVAP
jgi:peptidoglycan/LPS O-acetylase OafA/YrhL